SIQYTVPDAALFYRGVAHPEELLRNTTEAILRELAAGANFDSLLTTQRRFTEERTEELLRSRTQNGRAAGVQLRRVVLHDLHPPTEVVGAYHDVASAIQRRDQRVNEAQAEALRRKRRAEEEALRLVRGAGADAARKTADAAAQRDTFLAWHTARTQLTSVEEAALAVELAKRVTAGEAPAAVQADQAQRRATLLATRRALSELRLTLAAATQAFGSRDKVWIDADNLPGKRHLFFADPEANKLPPWLLRPPTTIDKERNNDP
ncbi:MAG: SPFH domain-containing protein, partial [Gemmataceae bacterium]